MRPRTVLVTSFLILAMILWILTLMPCSCGSETFANAIPQAKESSTIPTDTPGSTTDNPRFAEPDVKDLLDAKDAVNLFQYAYKPGLETQVTDANSQQFQDLLLSAPIVLEQVDASIWNPENPSGRVIVDATADTYRVAGNALRRIGPSAPHNPYEAVEARADPVGVWRDDNLLA